MRIGGRNRILSDKGMDMPSYYDNWSNIKQATESKY